MAGALEALLLLVNTAAAATLVYIAVRLARLALLLSSPLDAPIAFLALAAGHAAAGLAPLAPERQAFTLYVASSAFTAAGLLSLELSRRRRPQTAAAAVPIAVIPAASDIAAIAAGAWGAGYFRGPARLASTLYALGHAARLASLPLIPSQASALLLASGEALRAAAATTLSLAYTPRPATGHERDAQEEE